MFFQSFFPVGPVFTSWHRTYCFAEQESPWSTSQLIERDPPTIPPRTWGQGNLQDNNTLHLCCCLKPEHAPLGSSYPIINRGL